MAVLRPKPPTLNQWFAKRPLAAERACMTLIARQVEGLEITDWREFNRHSRTDWDKVYALRAAGSPPAESDYPRKWFVDARKPPLPGFWRVHGVKQKGHNFCPVCTGPTFHDGDWRFEAATPRWNRSWHAPCLQTSFVWTRYADYALYLARRQGGVCPETGEPIIAEQVSYHGKAYQYVKAGVEVDHVIPLWRVRLEGGKHPWPGVLRFWGLSNLQALSSVGHKRKTAREARERAHFFRTPAADLFEGTENGQAAAR